MNPAKALGPAILTFIAYIVFSGSVSGYDLITGTAIAVITGILVSDFLVTDTRKSLDIRRLGWLIAYAFYYLTIAELKSHLSFAPKVLSGRIRPGVVEVRTHLKTEYGMVTLANSITNTPGTATVDIDPEKQVLYVHWLWVESEDREGAREKIAKPFETFIKHIFEGGEQA